jgi:hypothetical protein
MVECGICYLDISNMVFLECSHSLCNNCYHKLRTHNCPFCRKPFIYIPKNIKENYNNSHIHFSRVRRNQIRNKRKNLSFEEVLERRQITRRKQKLKWLRKNGHYYKYINIYY